jgi:hypothetical protein
LHQEGGKIDIVEPAFGVWYGRRKPGGAAGLLLSADQSEGKHDCPENLLQGTVKAATQAVEWPPNQEQAFDWPTVCPVDAYRLSRKQALQVCMRGETSNNRN